jgi:mono/diheme cytochrome c family protein
MILRVLLLSLIAVSIIFSFAFAEGNKVKGKDLFNDPKLGNATSGKSCNTCHPDGKGLDKAADKEFNIGGKEQKGLEEAINFCIENAIKGKPLDPESEQMKDLVAYIKSLTGKTEE